MNATTNKFFIKNYVTIIFSVNGNT